METNKMADLLDIQKQISSKDGEKRQINDAMTNKFKEIEELKKNTPELDDLLKQQSRFQANSILGKNNNENDEKKLQEEIEKVKTNRALIDQYTNIFQALEEKKEEAEKSLDHLKSLHRSTLHQLIYSEMESIGSEYIETAQNLLDKFRRLQALAFIHDEIKGAHIDKVFTQNEHTLLSIPVFRLKSMRQDYNSTEWPVWKDSVYVNHQYSQYIEGDIKKEKTRFITNGIALY